jgi:hypothetical protein
MAMEQAAAAASMREDGRHAAFSLWVKERASEGEGGSRGARRVAKESSTRGPRTATRRAAPAHGGHGAARLCRGRARARARAGRLARAGRSGGGGPLRPKRLFLL